MKNSLHFHCFTLSDWKTLLTTVAVAISSFSAIRTQAETAPTTGTLLAPLEVELKRDGKVAGSMTLQPGTSVPILNWDGTRAQIRTAGGEVWVNTASEWEVSPIMDFSDKEPPRGDSNYVIAADVAMHGKEVKLAWVTPCGLWFAEQNGQQWQVKKVDVFPEGRFGLQSHAMACKLALSETGEPSIAYTLYDDRGDYMAVKFASRQAGEWKIETASTVHGELAAIGAMGGEPAICTIRTQGNLLRKANKGWRQQSLFNPKMQFYPLAAAFSGGNSIKLFGYDVQFPEGSEEHVSVLTAVRFDGSGSTTDTIETLEKDARWEMLLGGGGDRLIAACFSEDDAILRLADLGNPQQVQKISLASLGDGMKPISLTASNTGQVSVLFASQQGLAPLLRVVNPQLSLVEQAPMNKVFSMAGDSAGLPVIAFITSAGQLAVAKQTTVAKLATTAPENGVLSLPSPQIQELAAKSTVLPETVRPGSEQYRAERIAAIGEPTNFTLPVDGEEAEFTRWGTGDKVIVFFNHNGVRRSGDKTEDTMPLSIAAELDAYAPLIEKGYSLVAWNYPHTERLEREPKRDEDGPDLSGIATSVVEGVREKTGASELILVGNSMGAGVLLWDLPKLQDDSALRWILIAPTESFMPDPSKLPVATTATILANPAEDYHVKSDDVKAWLTRHRSPASDQLIPGQDHPILGNDLMHSTFANWLLEWNLLAATPQTPRSISNQPAAEKHEATGAVTSTASAQPMASNDQNRSESDNRLCLNSASQAQLENLPGVGPATAVSILEARPFQSVEELLQVRGIGPARLEGIRQLVTMKSDGP